MNRIIISFLAVITLILTGCSAKPSATTAPISSTPATAKAEAKKIKVVTAFYALEYLAKNIGGNAVTVESLVAPGTEPHDLELTPKQVAELGKADLVIYQKGFQGAVDKAVTEAKPKNILDTASFLTLLKEDEEHDHGHDGDKKDDKKDGHDHDGLDPHTWLDPNNMTAMANKIGETLTKISPDNTTSIKENTTKQVADLAALDTDFATGLKTCKTRTFITQHAAFGYLAKRYNLEQEGIAGLDPEVEPTAARIKEIMDEAKENNVTTIFYETLVSDKVAKTLANDLKLKTDVLDPLEGINEKSRGKNYIEVMRANLTALKTANGCQ